MRATTPSRSTSHPLLLIVTTALLAASGSLLSGCNPEEIDSEQIGERCDNGQDDDGDGLADCQDPSCQLFSLCAGQEHCFNGRDDDGDGLADCQDDACSASFLCLPNIEDCANGRDDDGDGLIDCQDDACSRTSLCEPGAESCQGGQDEDGDGQIDCEDEDCQHVYVCLLEVELLDNALDDDGDGLIDCEDEDYANTSSCRQGAESCQSGQDEDGDGLVDCQDPDCQRVFFCLQPAEACRNGVDDNLDGLVDCEDPKCQGDVSCREEVCNDGVDNNADGLEDCQDPSCEFAYNCLQVIVPVTKETACEDGQDDDGDELIDCQDPDCAEQSVCTACPLDAVSGQALDCQDPRCATNAQCVCDSASPVDAGVWGQVPDCSVPECVQTYPGCQQGLPDELCDGFGVDNDDNGQADCQDSSCSSLSQCACPLEPSGAPLDCSDARCASEDLCVCNASTNLIDRGAVFGLVPDCTSSECASTEPSCQPDLLVEQCDGDGVDNDNDGLIDCQDPDCHDFSDLNNSCTRLLCGDPQNAYVVLPYNGGSNAPLTIDGSAAWDAAFTGPAGATLKYGDLEIAASQATYTLNAASTLRCVVGDAPGANATLTIDGAALNDTSGLATFEVVDQLSWQREDNINQVLTGLSNLKHLTSSVAIIEPDYVTLPPPPIVINGLNALLTLRGSIEIVANEAAITRSEFDGYDGTQVEINGLNALTWVGGNLFETYGYEREEGEEGEVFFDSTLRGCGVELTSEAGRAPVKGAFTWVNGLSGLISLTYVGGDVCLALQRDIWFDFAGLKNLTEIGGDLLFGDLNPYTYSSPGSPPTRLTFTHLSSLERIGGSFGTGDLGNLFEPRYALLDNYVGLSSLSEVGASMLTLSEQSNLSGMPIGFTGYFGLTALETIGGDLELVGEGLTSQAPFAPLASLDTIGGTLKLEDTKVTSLQGLSLITLGGLELRSNKDLDPAGLAAISAITELAEGDLTLANNLKLSGALPFTALERINGDVRVDSEASLQSLSALEVIEGTLYFENYPTFTSIAAALPNLTRLGGFYLSPSSNLTSLTGFPTAGGVAGTTLAGSITLFGNGMLDLSALSGYTVIEGDLRLNKIGADLSALSSLQQVEGSFVLINTQLTALTGLSSLTSIGGELVLDDNAQLSDLTGLSSLSAVQRVEIHDSPLLTSLQGLGAIPAQLPLGLSLRDNKALADTTALAHITGVGRSLTLNNLAAASAPPLPNLTTLLGEGSFRMNVSSNPLLTDLSPLDSVALGQIDDLYVFISNNPLLCQSEVDGAHLYFSSALGMSYSSYLQDNKPGC